MAHIEGTWYVGKSYQKGILAIRISDGQEDEGDDQCVATILNLHPDDDTEQIEHANLIAAVHELLEACKEARTTLMLLQGDVRMSLKKDSCWEGMPETIQVQLDNIDDAIARANS